MDVGGGSKRRSAAPFFAMSREKGKKEEFPGFMENMLPGNSFPQICVVSVNKSVGNLHFVQGYVRIMTFSNRKYYSLVKGLADAPKLVAGSNQLPVNCVEFQS